MAQEERFTGPNAWEKLNQFVELWKSKLEKLGGSYATAGYCTYLSNEHDVTLYYSTDLPVKPKKPRLI